MTSRHEELTQMLPDYALGLLPQDAVTEIRTHIDSCPDCALELELIMALHEAPAPAPSGAFSTRLAASVIDAVQRERRVEPAQRWWHALWLMPQMVPAFGALAAAVIVLSVMLGGDPWQGPARSPQPQYTQQVALEAAVDDPLSYDPLDYDAIDQEQLTQTVAQYAEGYGANGEGLEWMTDTELDALDRALEQALAEHGQKI